MCLVCGARAIVCGRVVLGEQVRRCTEFCPDSFPIRLQNGYLIQLLSMLSRSGHDLAAILDGVSVLWLSAVARNPIQSTWWLPCQQLNRTTNYANDLTQSTSLPLLIIRCYNYHCNYGYDDYHASTHRHHDIPTCTYIYIDFYTYYLLSSLF